MRRPDFARCWNGSPRPRARTAFTLVELLVVTLVLLGLVALLTPALNCSRCRSPITKDSTQQRGIHQSLLVWAKENRDRMPTPSRIAAGLSSGPTREDLSLNHSAAFYSSLIMQNFFTPEVVVSPVEVSGLVTVDDDYDYTRYQPSLGVLWDTRFRADVSRGSDVSYAHLAMCGARYRSQWRPSLASNFPMLSTRGPGGGPFGLGGATDGEHFTRSITLEFFVPKDQWSGNLCFADNHIEVHVGQTHPAVTYQPAGAAKPLLDNFFAAEFLDAWVNGQAKPEASGDAWLGLFIDASADGLSSTPRFDPLTPP